MTPLNILFVHADLPYELNSAYWRCLQPAVELKRNGLANTTTAFIDDWVEGSVDALAQAADLIVLQRNLFGEVVDTVLRWREKGKVVALDIDDAYAWVHPSNPAYHAWRMGKTLLRDGTTQYTTPLVDQLQTHLKEGVVSALIAPSCLLLQDYAFMPGYCLPNYPSQRIYTVGGVPPEKRRAIGWGGSRSHYQSFIGSGALAGINAILRDFPEVICLLAGSHSDLYDLIDGRKELVNWVAIDRWPMVLTRFGVGVAPAAGVFDTRRSSLKVIEYLVMGIPWIASAGGPYDEFGDYGYLVENTPAAWRAALAETLENHDYYLGSAQRFKPHARQWTIEERVMDVAAVYQQVYEEQFRG